MIPLDRFDKWSSQLNQSARQFLNDVEYERYQSILEHERLRQLKALLERPIAHFSPVNEVFFRARWAEALGAIHESGDLTLLEVGSGDADMVPHMMAHNYPHSRYICANMNRILTKRLRAKTKYLKVELMVIEEDAVNITDYLQPESVDIIAFQHAVNDVIQAILCDQNGIDTVYTDWMEMLPLMIHIIQKEFKQDTLEAHVKPGFLSLLEKLCQVLKPGGFMVMSHYMFQLDLDWGYPPVLWENYIPITREWITELPNLTEKSISGFDPQWWLFYQKI